MSDQKYIYPQEDILAEIVELRESAGSANQRTADMLEQLLEACHAQQPAQCVSELSRVQPVPAHCDKIVWRGHYYHLPPEAKIAEQPAPELHWCTNCMGVGPESCPFNRPASSPATGRDVLFLPPQSLEISTLLISMLRNNPWPTADHRWEFVERWAESLKSMLEQQAARTEVPDEGG